MRLLTSGNFRFAGRWICTDEGSGASEAERAPAGLAVNIIAAAAAAKLVYTKDFAFSLR
jgi:hypothetical protein